MRGKIKTLHDKLLRREITAQNLAERYLSYISENDGELSSYITITKEEALEAAKRVDAKLASGAQIPLLAGIPMTIKDNISTKGILTSCASKMLSNYKPVYDAFVTQRLKSLDAVLLGKTNMDEFAMGSTCETSYYGPTKNPFDTGRVPGGSSGGVAAAVAADLAVYGLGSDTGGSVRQPASFCGMIGLKPTYGAVSRRGLIAYASSLDQVGVIGQSVEDTAIVYDAIAAYDDKDATCADCPRPSAYEGLDRDIRGLKIGVLENLFEGLNPEIDRALNAALDSFRSLGAEIIPVSIEQFNLSLPVYYILACAEASSNLSRYDGVRYGYRTEEFFNTEEMICKTRDEGFGLEVKRRIMLGNYVLSSGYYDAYYKKAMNMRDALRTSFASAFNDVDLLFCPTVASTAFELGAMSGDPVEMYLTDLCTVPVNICGLPAVSVPCGFDKNSMPIGMQLIGSRFSEATLLRAAYRYEEKNHETMYKKPEIGGDCLGI